MLEEDILKQMSELKSVYGEGAKMCLQNPDLRKQFLSECYCEIQENKIAMEEHFSSKIVESIVSYINGLEKSYKPI